MSKIYHPLATKTVFHAITPIQWAGGQLMELFKGKGSPAQPKSYRDVILADADGKAFLGNMRAKSKGSLFQAIPDSQFGGGANHGATACASVLARSQACI
eukprot:4976525-Karenia_brevis.AAC.1